jgi:hypothetical protein
VHHLVWSTSQLPHNVSLRLNSWVLPIQPHRPIATPHQPKVPAPIDRRVAFMPAMIGYSSMQGRLPLNVAHSTVGLRTIAFARRRLDRADRAAQYFPIIKD